MIFVGLQVVHLNHNSTYDNEDNDDDDNDDYDYDDDNNLNIVHPLDPFLFPTVDKFLTRATIFFFTLVSL